MEIKTQVKGKRTRTFFAWLPITVYNQNISITKWLEMVTVEEIYVESHVSPIGEYFNSYWSPVKFV